MLAAALGSRMLIAMAGLPGAGKSTVAEALARALPGVVLAVDPVEAAMLRAGVASSEPTGLAAYNVVKTVADGLLAAEYCVIVDAVNDSPRAREQWVGAAVRRGAPVHFIEVVCTDVTTHRRRFETRRRGIPGFPEPEWDVVLERRAGLNAWDGDRLVLDSMNDAADNVADVLEYLDA